MLALATTAPYQREAADLDDRGCIALLYAVLKHADANEATALAGLGRSRVASIGAHEYRVALPASSYL